MRERSEPASDSSLMAAASHGEEAAFRALFDRHQLALYRLCRSLPGVEHDLALDLVQESFVRLFRRLAEQKPVERFFPCLATTARRCWFDARHAMARRQQVIEQWQSRGQPAGAGGEAVAEEEQDAFRREAACACVDEVLEELPEGETKVIATLYYREGLGTRVIAEQLGLPASTVTTRLARFRGRIRQTLARRLLDLRGYP